MTKNTPGCFPLFSQMIEQGRMSEEEAEYMIVQALKDPKSEGRDEFIEKTERKAKVDTKDLVAALNEHLELRHDGNRLYGMEDSTNQKKEKSKKPFRFLRGYNICIVFPIHRKVYTLVTVWMFFLRRPPARFMQNYSYKNTTFVVGKNRTLSFGAKKLKDARQKYEEALSIVNFVSGLTPGDQKEIDMNKAACLMNIGAVCVELKDFGEAVQHLNKAQEIVPNNIKLLMRRARAHVGKAHGLGSNTFGN